MNITLLFIIVAALLIFIIIYRSAVGEQTYKFVKVQTKKLYSKVAPYTYKEIKKKIKDLGQDYTTQQYIGQVILFAAGAGIIVYKSLVKVIIPMMRNITYFFVSAQEKFSDTMAVQAQLIEANAYKLQLSTTSGLSDEKKKKIVQKQLKIAEKLKKIANKFAINTVKAEKQTQKDIKEDDKKATVVDNGSGTGILF